MNKSARVTLEDIASRAGVSSAAVSQALSGKGALSQATRERILQVVEELAYQPDLTAQSLALRRASQADGKRLDRPKSKLLPPPGVMVFYNIPELAEVLHLEIQQMDEEGYEVSQFRQQLAAWNKPTKQKLYNLYSAVLAAAPRADFGCHEPSALAEIHQERPPGPRQAELSLSAGALYERVHGAWLGRTAGCVLGKPLQAGWSKSQVTRYLRLAESYPLSNYVPRLVPPPPGLELKPDSAGTFLGEICGAPSDDDTDFTLLALHILETCGLDFKTASVATEWLNHLPYFGTYTTERAVYRNLVWNVHPDEAASFANPEREFIGARTRADLFGWVAPARPELAAALAYKDAVLSHTKNGVYSAMFQAAMLAWAYVTGNPRELVEVGLSEIPQRCRLAEAIRDALDAHQNGEDWELAYEHLILKYGAYSPIHALNNTLWVTLALLYGAGDFERTLGIAVACGMDTGSNAASAGSLLGLICSAPNLAPKWTDPLQNTLHTAVSQFKEQSISNLAQRTARIASQVLSANPGTIKI